MRTISGTFASRDAADKAVEGLEAAGIPRDAISVNETDGGGEAFVSATVENESADAAHAVISEAGGRMVEETNLDAMSSDPDLEREDVERLREPIPPLAAPNPH